MKRFDLRGYGANYATRLIEFMNTEVKILGLKNTIIPSTRHLSKYCYINYEDIIKEDTKICKIKNVYLLPAVSLAAWY